VCIDVDRIALHAQNPLVTKGKFGGRTITQVLLPESLEICPEEDLNLHAL
jgi:hypothetical protein